jgi:hypothetical protein
MHLGIDRLCRGGGGRHGHGGVGACGGFGGDSRGGVAMLELVVYRAETCLDSGRCIASVVSELTCLTYMPQDSPKLIAQ